MRRTTITVVCYGGALLLLLLIVTKQLTDVLPEGLATQIGHNSESLALFLLLGPMIQWLRPAALRSGRRWLWPSVFAVACVVGGYACLHVSDLPGSIVTLNEPLIAAGLLGWYVMIPRPRAWLPWVGVVVALAAIALHAVPLVDQQAESVAMLALLPIGLDAVHRSTLEPDQPRTPSLTVAWCVVLVVLWEAFRVLRHHDLGGFGNGFVLYNAKAAEAYWAAFLIAAYFGLLLPRRAQS